MVCTCKEFSSSTGRGTLITMKPTVNFYNNNSEYKLKILIVIENKKLKAGRNIFAIIF